MSKKVIDRQFIHSLYLSSKFGDAVVVKEKLKYDTGEVVPNVVTFDNPKRSYYITNPRYRSYNFKPEYELLSRLDKYTVYNHELKRHLANTLKLGPGFHRDQQLFKSPYVFGADISIEALIKMRYKDEYPNSTLRPTVGFFDIETSIETGQIIIISYLHDDIVHTAILKSFFYEEVKKHRIPINLDDLIPFIENNLENRTNGFKFKYDVKVFDREIQLIYWIMQQVHESKIDYISIWNMNFDIPKVLDSIVKSKFNPAQIFHNPELDKSYQYLKYYEDQRKTAHFSLKWHWLYSSCGSQFIDAMGLYSQCRRTQGYLDKYGLDNILDKELKIGKLPLISGSHTVMQRHHFKEYIVYNIFDVIGLKLLEDKINDFYSLFILADVTPISKFSTQTIRSTNDMYHNIISKGMVLSSKSEDDDFVKFDKFFGRVGGAVLHPGRVKGVGLDLTFK